jgi:uncharacterized protein (DUF433 family)
VNQAAQNQPEGGLFIRDGYAAIAAWGWNSTQDTILGIPIIAYVTKTVPSIPDRGERRPSLYLTFTNGWVLALDTPFANAQEPFPPKSPPIVFGSAYIGEADHVFDLASFRKVDRNRNLSDLSALETTIYEVARFPLADRNELIATYIDTDPYRPGVADAILIDSGVHVWAIMGAILLTGATPDEVARDYDIPREAVDAAIAYYRQYRPVIIARIAANNVGAA